MPFQSHPSAGSRSPIAANRHGVDYALTPAALNASFDPAALPGGGIIDFHTHITGPESAAVYDRARRAFGVRLTYSMTQLHQAAKVRDVLGDSIRFIAFPSFAEADKANAFGPGYVRVIEEFAAKFGSRMLKIWNSPRLRDIVPKEHWDDICFIDSPWRIKQCEVGRALGMSIMVHVADPDTWFRAKYNQADKYGVKADHYRGLERMLDRFDCPWVAAHMGGWPEDLVFLDGLLARHGNLHLDCSATKWIVRELSRDAAASRAFLIKWKGRIVFGSDIVASDDHMRPQKATQHPMGDLADSPEAAFDLYASRYWALRVMLETDYDGESNIADPDLAMVEPEKFNAMSAPHLRGLALPRDVLEEMYVGIATRLGW